MKTELETRVADTKVKSTGFINPTILTGVRVVCPPKVIQHQPKFYAYFIYLVVNF